MAHRRDGVCRMCCTGGEHHGMVSWVAVVEHSAVAAEVGKLTGHRLVVEVG